MAGKQGAYSRGLVHYQSDFSAGMLQQAQLNLQGVEGKFNFEIIDAQQIPWVNESCEVAIANHMLYHLSDRARALSEIRRILKPGASCTQPQMAYISSWNCGP
jgi:ubiquinone/menaquinone biosynthesis C-methylase UbiE